MISGLNGFKIISEILSPKFTTALVATNNGKNVVPIKAEMIRTIPSFRNLSKKLLNIKGMEFLKFSIPNLKLPHFHHGKKSGNNRLKIN